LRKWEEMDWQLSERRFAMRLLRQHKQQIGVIVPAAIELGRQVVQGVSAWCNRHPGARMALISEFGYGPRMAFPNEALDCLVVLNSRQADLEGLCPRCRNIVVTSNREVVSGFARVINDEHAVGAMGAAHLLAQGYRTLAFLNPDKLQFAQERAKGFSAVVSQAGRACRLYSANNQPEVMETVVQLLALPGPVAVMAASDLHARWLVDALEDPQTVIPNQLAVLGVDNDSLQSALSLVPISSIAIAGERIGYEAAALGMRLARGEADHQTTIRIAPKHVVSRRSTDAIAIKDRTIARALRLMRERMADFVDAADLIRELGVPRRTVEYKFHKATGSSLAYELTSARICRARELLATTDLSVKEIAYLVGFSEPRMLTLVFKRHTGELPSQFRDRIRP
jgi:LacI family transcriptional regulator